MSNKATQAQDPGHGVLVQEFIRQVWNEGDVSRLSEFVTEDYRSHDPVDPEPVRGPAALADLVAGYRRAFPDLVNTIEDQLVDGDRVATRWTSVGTHLGPALGLQATGRTRHVSGIVLSHMKDGRIAEEWHSWDTVGLLRQLGGIDWSPSASRE